MNQIEEYLAQHIVDNTDIDVYTATTCRTYSHSLLQYSELATEFIPDTTSKEFVKLVLFNLYNEINWAWVALRVNEMKLTASLF